MNQPRSRARSPGPLLLLSLLLPATACGLQEASLLLRDPAQRPESLSVILVLDQRAGAGDTAALAALQRTARALLLAQPAGRAGLVHHDATGQLRVQAPAPLAQVRDSLLLAIDEATVQPEADIDAALQAAGALMVTTDACATAQLLLIGQNRPPRRWLANLPGLQWAPGADATEPEQARARLLAPVPRADAPHLLVMPLAPPGFARPPRHQGAAYLTLFQAGTQEYWQGNLHRFRHDGRQVVDSEGRAALDPATSKLSSTAVGDWMEPADAGRLAAGGAAARLPAPAARRLYSNLAGSELRVPDNAVTADNPLALAALGPQTAAERIAAIDFIRDSDLSGIADSLHGSAVLLPDPDRAGDEGLLFLATNAGLLHAIDTSSGRERWAFLPARLLPRLLRLQGHAPAGYGRSHGLDGGLRLASPASPAAPRAILLAAMRRGGDGLSALDVSDPDHPRLLWELDGGSPGFPALGETWSLPVPARIRIAGTVRDVAVFGGGHEPSQDQSQLVPAARGNALYIVDLATGALLASAGGSAGHALVLPAMRYAIPASPLLVDVDQDGLADRIYVGDTGGQVWRLDIRDGTPALLAGGIIAELGSTAGSADPRAARRFYATPDAVFAGNGADGPVVQVQLGSGHRPRLLEDAVADAFFAVRDRVPPGLLDDPDRQPIRFADLTDISGGEAAPATGDSAGWRLAMVAQRGEKILEPALSVHGRLYFSSFAPGSSASCGEPVGINRLYELDLRDGRLPPIPPASAPGTEPAPPRARLLRQVGIAPGPALFWPADGPAMLCAGIECEPMDPALLAPRRSWWRWSSQR